MFLAKCTKILIGIIPNNSLGLNQIFVRGLYYGISLYVNYFKNKIVLDNERVSVRLENVFNLILYLESFYELKLVYVI
jgi:hypothetical protein